MKAERRIRARVRRAVIAAAVLLCLLACGCDAEPDANGITVNVGRESVKMFTDEREAAAKIEELKETYIYASITEEESLRNYMALLARADDVVSGGENVCEYAEELCRAFDALEYKRGDTPRVYLNTFKPCENYAAESTVSASSEPSPEHSVAMATDGDSKTYWLSSDEEEQTLVFDMGRKCELGYFSLEWGKGAAKEVELDVSEDGEKWKTVLSFSDGARYKTQGGELPEKVRARYFRVRMLSASSLPYRLEEVTASYAKPERAAALTKEYKDAEIVIVDREGGKYTDIVEPVKIKVRGNSTANTVKNPYNIKFGRKMKILGMKGTKKWALIANLFDKTLIRNKLASDFSAAAGVSPKLKSAFVEVYLDGEYKGCYLLTMPVTDGTVGIDVEKGEMLLERNGYYNAELAGVNYNYTPIKGIRFVPIAPEKGEETEEQKEKIKKLLSDVEYAVISGDRKRVESVIDVDSFVNMYICEELMKDIDIYHGSTYFYYKNGLLYSGPMWDMDLSMGNVSERNGALDEKYAKYYNLMWDGKKAGNGKRGDSTTGNWAKVDFYEPLMENMWFRDLVKERYTELIPEIERLYCDGGVIDGYVEEYGGAFRRNYEQGGYSMTAKYFDCEYDRPSKTYEENVEYLKQWLAARDSWIREDLKIK